MLLIDTPHHAVLKRLGKPIVASILEAVETRAKDPSPLLVDDMAPCGKKPINFPFNFSPDTFDWVQSQVELHGVKPQAIVRAVLREIYPLNKCENAEVNFTVSLPYRVAKALDPVKMAVLLTRYHDRTHGDNHA